MCNSCGECCHGLAVELTEEEEARIDPDLYQDLLRGDDFAETAFINADEPAKRLLRQRPERNQACIFLSRDGLCYVHARQGMAAKPDACQQFPAMVFAVPDGPPRLGVRTNCQSMHLSFEKGPSIADLAPHVMRIIGKGEVHKAPKQVRFFGRKVSFSRFDRVLAEIRNALSEDGLTTETLSTIDRAHFRGRLAKARRGYGRRMLAYIDREKKGPAPVEEGAYGELVRRARRGMDALRWMRAGRAPPNLSKRNERFLRAQTRHALYLCGPLNLPDAGYGLVALLLTVEAAMHAVGERGTLKTANTAFDVFTNPILESTEHCWPILDAIDSVYARRLRKEL